jgi:hypothetical protein
MSTGPGPPGRYLAPAIPQPVTFPESAGQTRAPHAPSAAAQPDHVVNATAARPPTVKGIEAAAVHHHVRQAADLASLGDYRWAHSEAEASQGAPRKLKELLAPIPAAWEAKRPTSRLVNNPANSVRWAAELQRCSQRAVPVVDFGTYSAKRVLRVVRTALTRITLGRRADPVAAS